MEVRISLRLAQKTPERRVLRTLKEEGVKDGSGFQPHVQSSMPFNRRIAICEGRWLGQVVMTSALDQLSLQCLPGRNAIPLCSPKMHIATRNMPTGSNLLHPYVGGLRNILWKGEKQAHSSVCLECILIR